MKGEKINTMCPWWNMYSCKCSMHFISEYERVETSEMTWHGFSRRRKRKKEKRRFIWQKMYNISGDSRCSRLLDNDYDGIPCITIAIFVLSNDTWFKILSWEGFLCSCPKDKEERFGGRRMKTGKLALKPENLSRHPEWRKSRKIWNTMWRR